MKLRIALTILVFFLLVLIPNVSALGLSPYNRSIDIGVGETKCIDYGVYNPSNEDLKVQLIASGEIEEFTKIKSSKAIAAKTDVNNAVPLEICFKIPGSEECKLYTGEVTALEKDGQLNSVGAELKINVLCTGSPFNWSVIILLGVIVSIGFSAFYYKKRKPKKKVIIPILIILALFLFLPLVSASPISCNVDRTCDSNNLCKAQVWSTCMFMKDMNGDYQYTTVVLKTVWEDGYNGYFNISWKDKFATIRPYVIYKGTEYNLSKIHDLFPEIEFGFDVTQYNHQYKYAINITGIPDSIKDDIDYIKLYLEETRGLSWSDVKLRGHKIIIKDKVELGFGDLKASGFTITHPNKRTILIHNVSGKNDLYLDPTTSRFSPSSEDTFIKIDYPTLNHGSNTTMQQEICLGPCSPDHWEYTYVKFDLSTLEGADILDVNWTAFVTGCQPDGASLQMWELPNQSWIESYPTWNNRHTLGGVNTTTGSFGTGNPTNCPTGEWFTRTGLESVADRYAGLNFSFLLNTTYAPASQIGQDMNSSESVSPHYLNITYEPDVYAPTLDVEYPVNTSALTSEFGVNITGTANDSNPLNITINNSDFTNYGNYTNWNFTNNTPISSGHYVVNITANDTLGYSNSTLIFFSYLTKSTLFSEEYPANSLETLGATFIATVTFSDGENPYVYLVYNGTPYQASQSNRNDNNATYTKVLNIPLLDATYNESRSFFWNITDSDGSYSTAPHSHLVFRMYLTNCTSPATTQVINFTLIDEISNTAVSGDLAGTWNFWATESDGSLYRNYSNGMDGRTYFDFCIYPNWANLTANIYLNYEASGYEPRRSHYPLRTLTNTSENISLYLLSTGNATTFKVTVRDNSYLYYPNHVVRTLKYQASTDSFIIVESCTTDIDATCLTHLILEDETYRFMVVTESGTIVHTTGNYRAYCPQTNVYDQCLFTVLIPPDLSIGSYVWDDIAGLSYSVTHSNATNISSLTYSFTEGSINYIRFKVSQGTTTICNENSSAIAGIINCNLVGYNGTVKEQVFLSRSDELAIFTLYRDLGLMWATFGEAGVFLLMLLIIALAVASVAMGSPLASIILVVAALGVATVTGIGGIGMAPFILIAVAASFIIYKLRQ